MTNVIVAKQKTVQVSVNSVAGIISTVAPVTLKNNPVLSTTAVATTVEGLLDVNVVSKVNGATLVFDSATNTFLIEPLNYSEINGNIDGGSF
jgi:hypothetical protein